MKLEGTNRQWQRNGKLEVTLVGQEMKLGEGLDRGGRELTKLEVTYSSVAEESLVCPFSGSNTRIQDRTSHGTDRGQVSEDSTSTGTLLTSDFPHHTSGDALPSTYDLT
ncbi:hypothetical protein AVEN_103826-1 [Araneus ventricosus]|uniref:Uncharacterized protein n=1 Tax=Araneus ventricosus TaxID=182803 RepID=A0A4Y2V9F9_ARAVE|nr:hypothetical protein AVEN_103826-1 [Araneus ventricosus]